MSPVEPGGCPRTSEVGVYLLGAMHPEERADYAAHLAHCPDCLREVGQLAGLPGLLSRTGEPAADALTAVPAPRPAQPRPEPDEQPAGHRAAAAPGPVAGALTAARRQRARGRALVAAGFVLVAVVGVGATSVVTAARAAASPTAVTAAARLPVPMDPVGEVKATAAVELTSRAWGTQVVMRCRYLGDADADSPVYVLVATAKDGSATELARWTAIPDQDIVLASATELDHERLAGLEVRNAAGKVVLRAEHV
ncbi:MAG TPA: zf-HC2 domain-containing protein [Pseudonocardia sp.]